MTQALEAARSSGTALVVLVGDEPYYGRFGFKPVPFGQIVFPGPVNPARILACELKDGACASYRGLDRRRAIQGARGRLPMKRRAACGAFCNVNHANSRCLLAFFKEPSR